MCTINNLSHCNNRNYMSWSNHIPLYTYIYIYINQTHIYGSVDRSTIRHLKKKKNLFYMPLTNQVKSNKRKPLLLFCHSVSNQIINQIHIYIYIYIEYNIYI